MQTATIEYLLDSEIKKTQSTRIPLDFVMFKLNSGALIYQRDIQWGSDKWSVLQLDSNSKTTVKELFKVAINKEGIFKKGKRFSMQLHRFVANRLYPAYYYDYNVKNNCRNKLSFHIEPPEGVLAIFKEAYGKKFTR